MNRGARPEGRIWNSAASQGHKARSINSAPRADAHEAADARRKLEALFGGAAPGGAHAAGNLPTRNYYAPPRKQTNRKPSEHSMRLERLRIARDARELEEAAAAFLAHHHQLPDDMDILLKMLMHSNERVLCDVLGQISGLLAQRRHSATVVLTHRLKDLSERNLSHATLSCVEGLKGQIAKLAG